MNIRRVLSIVRKEWWHITRDPTSFMLLLLSPALLLVTLGYAFSIDIENVTIAVYDQDRSPTSRELIRQLSSSDELRLGQWPGDLAEVERALMRGSAKAVLVIPPDFEKAITTGDTASLQILVDGTDPNTAGYAIRHLAAHSEQFITSKLVNDLLQAGFSDLHLETIDLRVRAWYNPSLRYTVSMIPALVGVVLSVPAMAASLAIAREREWGTLEGLVATPVRRFELIIGKLLPYLIAGLLSIPLCIAIAVYGYKVPFRGNLVLYLAISVVFLFATMSISLFISVFAKSQQVAIIASMIIFLFSGFFLSGLLIPFSLMGPIIKLEAFMMPTTHFVIISRGLFTKAATLDQLSGYVISLVGIGLVFIAMTILMFKKKI